MDAIRLNLSQVLAVAWVWQVEVLPKYIPIWKQYNVACGCNRKPELHVAAYNSLLDQLLSDTKRENLEYTKGAMSMLAFNAGHAMIAFEPATPFRHNDPEWDAGVEELRRLIPGRIIAYERIMETPLSDKREAKRLIRQILSVDDKGNLLYDSPGIDCMVFKPSHYK